jgi:hypothetical protein
MGNGFVTAIDDKIAWVWVLEKVPSTIPYPLLFFYNIKAIPDKAQ